MGIEIELTGKCRGCRIPDLRLHQKETYVKSTLVKREYFAKCNNEDTCRKVVEFFALAVMKEKEVSDEDRLQNNKSSDEKGARDDANETV